MSNIELENGNRIRQVYIQPDQPIQEDLPSKDMILIILDEGTHIEHPPYRLTIQKILDFAISNDMILAFKKHPKTKEKYKSKEEFKMMAKVMPDVSLVTGRVHHLMKRAKVCLTFGNPRIITDACLSKATMVSACTTMLDDTGVMIPSTELNIISSLNKAVTLSVKEKEQMIDRQTKLLYYIDNVLQNPETLRHWCERVISLS